MDSQFIGKMLAGIFWNSTIPLAFAYLGGVVLLSSFLIPVFWPNWKIWSGKMMKSERARRWMKRGVIIGGVLLIFIGLILSASNIYENKTAKQQQTIADLEGTVTLLENQLQQAPKSFALPEELLASHLTGLKIRLTSMTLDYVLLENKVFDDCTFYGPAVIQFQDPTVTNNVVFSLEGGGSIDSIFIKSTNTIFMGVVGFKNCIFNNCTFVHIGYIATPEIIDVIKSRVYFIQ